MGSERDRAIAEAVRDAAWQAAYEAKGEPACAPVLRLDLDAIIAAVTAPAPDLPREVAMRIAEEVRASIFESADECAAGWFIPEGPPSTTLAAIVSRHLHTDEEREAERAVLDLLFVHGRSVEFRDAMERLRAIRAKRGAR